MKTTDQEFMNFWRALLFAGIFHGVSLHLLGDFKPNSHKTLNAIKVRITTPPPAPAIAQTEPVPPKVIPKPKKQKRIAKTKSQATPKELPKPIQGLNENSVSKTGNSGFAAPVGNTLLVEDRGIRTNHAEELPTEDLSQGPRLLSIDRPDYTNDALDAGVEGRFSLDVLVDELGKVLEAELKKKIGYGMDEKIITAVLAARFSPPTNRFGQAEKNWGEIVIKLELP